MLSNGYGHDEMVDEIASILSSMYSPFRYLFII